MRFSDGSVQGGVDLLVGADGIDSTVRATAFPSAPGPAPRGYDIVRGIAPGDSSPAL